MPTNAGAGRLLDGRFRHLWVGLITATGLRPPGQNVQRSEGGQPGLGPALPVRGRAYVLPRLPLAGEIDLHLSGKESDEVAPPVLSLAAHTRSGT